MKAVIMAGGEGTRLRPLTCNLPKPMVPIVNKPVMEHIVELLKKYSVTDIAVTLQYLPERIREYFHDGQDFGVKMEYFTENKPLGTAGSIKNAEAFLDDTFIVISGDALTDINLKKAMDFHRNKGSLATLVLKKVDYPLSYGVVMTEEDGRISKFLEKPGWGEVFSDNANTGIYILSPQLLRWIKKDEKFDFSKDLFPLLLKEGMPIYGYVTEDYWCDIGDLHAYLEANHDVLNGKVNINIPGIEIKEKVWIGEGAEWDDSVELQAPCVVGRHCRIKEGSFIGAYSILGDDTSIDENSSIKQSILWKNSQIRKCIELRGSVVCRRVQMKDRSSAYECSVIGDETVIRENAMIKPNIRIWPNKVVEEGVQLNSNFVWGASLCRSTFGNRGVTGEINCEITPEHTVKLGAAFASVLKDKKRVGISSDRSVSAQMLKLSLSSGLISAGAEVYDFGELLLPSMRQGVRAYSLEGGIHVSSFHHHPSKVVMDFLDPWGCNISREFERKIENALIREDFKRCEGDGMKGIKKVGDFHEYYMKTTIKQMKSRKLPYRILLKTNSKLIAETVIELMTGLGCVVEIFLPGLCERNAPSMREMADTVREKEYDLGVCVEEPCEKMVLIDRKGNKISEDLISAVASILLLKSRKGRSLVVPVSASQIIEKLAHEYQGAVIRINTSSRDVINPLLGKFSDEDILEQFTMNYDAIYGLTQILDFMHTYGYQLSDLMDMIPRYHRQTKEVECPWNAKGRVIRRILEENRHGNIETIEGVKVFRQEGWVLVLPDSEKPVCKIISESHNAEFAEELSNVFVNKVREISKN